MNQEAICYIHRSAVLVHPNGHNKTYLFSYNNTTHVRNVIIDNGKEIIEKEGRTRFNIRALISTWLHLGYYVLDSRNMNNGKYIYDFMNEIPA